MTTKPPHAGSNLQAISETLLASLYDGVMSASGFQEFIETLRSTFQLRAVTMIIRNVHTLEVKNLWSQGITEEWVSKYALDYGREDILAHHVMASPIAHFYASNLDLPASAAFQKSRFNQEWLLPQDIAQSASAIVLQEGSWITEIFAQRSSTQPDFTREELHTLNYLIQHMRRAIQMRQRMASLQQDRGLLAGALDLLIMPAILFDEHGKLAHANSKAEAMLNDGSTLHVIDQHLLARDLAASRKLAVEIANAVSASRGSDKRLNEVVLIPRSNRSPLMLLIAPMRVKRPSAQVYGAALMVAFDPEQMPQPANDQLRKLFGLTPSEADITAALCRGLNLEDIAHKRGASSATVRSQLKSVFTKTGASRQAELVSLVLASPAYFIDTNSDALQLGES